MMPGQIPFPPPPPSLSQHWTSKNSSPPRPGYAAIPWNSKESPPIQETGGSSEAPHDSQGASDSPLLSEQNGLQSPPSQGQEDNLSDHGEPCHPQQETDPAPNKS